MIRRIKAELVHAYRGVRGVDPKVWILLSVSVVVGVAIALAHTFAGVRVMYGVAAAAALGLWSVSRVRRFAELHGGREHRRTAQGRWRRRRRWRW